MQFGLRYEMQKPDEDGLKSGSLSLPIASTEECSSGSFKVQSSGGFRIERLSLRGTGFIAEGRFGYSIDFLFFC